MSWIANLITLFVLAGSVQQPSQTPSGARAFIRMILTNGSTNIAVPLHNGQYNTIQVGRSVRVYKCNGFTQSSCAYVNEDRYGTRQIEIYASKVSDLDNCTMQLDLRVPDRMDGQLTYVSPIETIRWNYVTGVSQSGTTVTIAGSKSFRFYLSSEDLATRFAFASKFLRDACDPTAATGF